MMTGQSITSSYEAWVLALRAWAEDPRRDISELPALQADSLPPAAYERLLGHIMSAQSRVMQTWQRRLERDLKAVRTEQDYARALVDLRALLGRRLQLARHPGLPTQIQEPLREGVERDIQRMQQELEAAVMQPGRGGRTDRTGQQRLLFQLRTNSFTAILAPGFPLDSLFHAEQNDPPTSPAPTTLRPATPSATALTSRRRVVLDGEHRHPKDANAESD